MIPICMDKIIAIKPRGIIAQKTIDKLPLEFRHMPMALDVAELHGGGYKIIESNPQGNSGFLTILRSSSRALDALLKKVPEMSERGEIHWGLNGEQQMKFILHPLRK